MKTLEIFLLIGAYSTIIITLFISIICYRRNLESRETIAFIASLLLLILSIAGTTLLEEQPRDAPTNVFVLSSMVLVGLTTPLSLLQERKHSLSPIWKTVVMVAAILLLISIVIAYSVKRLATVESPVVIFLAVTVVSSMVFMQTTKPIPLLAKQEKANRVFSVLFLVLVPLSLVATYAPGMNQDTLSIGFALPLVFILLALNKLLDDLHRLALIKPSMDLSEQHYENFGLTDREKEVTSLLVLGRTYKEIAERLFISLPTVKTHAGNIYRKCNVNSRHELTMLLIS
ncbi:MAG: LuxR C-terminal-related transcriptional regulator [Saprospiraceae bacterium]|nr:LuxR C-terminal-related transcriptional regulator [Saprospiraceae bacterium]